MNYLTLADIHNQVIIEDNFTEDDHLLEIMGDAAENFLEGHLNQALDDITADNGGELPKNLYLALLMLVDYFYDARGSGDNHDIPPAFYVLCKPWMTYTIA